MVLKRRKDYDDALEDYAWKLLSEVSLSGVRFESVTACVSEAAGLQVEVDKYNIGQKECIYDSQAPGVASHRQRDCPAIH